MLTSLDTSAWTCEGLRRMFFAYPLSLFLCLSLTHSFPLTFSIFSYFMGTHTHTHRVHKHTHTHTVHKHTHTHTVHKHSYPSHQTSAVLDSSLLFPQLHLHLHTWLIFTDDVSPIVGSEICTSERNTVGCCHTI